jgi:hypothetical protein
VTAPARQRVFYVAAQQVADLREGHEVTLTDPDGTPASLNLAVLNESVLEALAVGSTVEIELILDDEPVAARLVPTSPATL